jgi:hypothetical protein
LTGGGKIPPNADVHDGVRHGIDCGMIIKKPRQRRDGRFEYVGRRFYESLDFVESFR